MGARLFLKHYMGRAWALYLVDAAASTLRKPSQYPTKSNRQQKEESSISLQRLNHDLIYFLLVRC